MSEHKRFTKKINGRYVQYSVTGCYNEMNGKGDYTTGASVERFGELEDKFEIGLLKELPCKVDDTIYYICDFGSVSEEYFSLEIGRVDSISIRSDGVFIHGIYDNGYLNCWHQLANIGKIVFFNQDQAEAKLKELQEGK